MKLYLMQCGVLYSDKGVFVEGCSGKYDVPVPYFLIEHEKGYVLFDSGHNRNTVENPSTLNQVILESFCPSEIGDGFVLDALKNAGIKPEEIVYHVCSHLHFDHAGGIGLFPNATYVVQEEELRYAHAPNDPAMEVVYFNEDFEKDVKWLKLNGKKDNMYDLFNDGKLIVYHTPGHTPGCQSLLVNLERDKPMFLAQDACFTEENLNNLKLPGSVFNATEYINTLKMLKDMQNKGVQIVPGHDPCAWGRLKKFPEFYS